MFLGVSVCEAVRNCGISSAFLKWPNDIFVINKKACGMLFEINKIHLKSGKEVLSMSIGIGINVNQDSFPEQLVNIASSLKLALNAAISREKLLAEILNIFEEVYLDVDKSHIIQRYKPLNGILGKKIEVFPKNMLFIYFFLNFFL
jgi:BirA family biotin operon repressor/biotin-[acetyl-CoA-carboxylase] ligase